MLSTLVAKYFSSSRLGRTIKTQTHTKIKEKETGKNKLKENR